MVADVVSVGVTNKTATGHILHFTNEYLAKHVKELIGKPVNILLLDGKASGHSKNVIGSITSANFDPLTEKIQTTAALWRHYYPEAVRKVVELFGDGALETSVELMIDDFDEEESEEGVHITPKDGVFSGLGIVSKGADPRNRVLALAEAYDEDVATLAAMPSIQPMTVATTNDAVTNFVITTTTDSTNGTVSDSLLWNSFESSSEADVSRNDTDNGEANMPIPIVAESAEEASDKQPADSQEDWKAMYEELSAQVAAEKAQLESDKRVSERLSELEKIAPTTETQREAYTKMLSNLDDDAYQAMKQILLSAVTPAQGIASDAEVEPTEDEIDVDEAVVRDNLPKWRQEALEAFPPPVDKKE